MIGKLPRTLKIDDKEYPIRTDYRNILRIFEAYNDPELTEFEKAIILIKILFVNYEDIKNWNEAKKQAEWFMSGGKNYSKITNPKKIMDWEQDECLIFSAINKVANKEIREVKYLHWWTFLGYFSEIESGLFTTVIHIRNKKNKGKKLEKYEEEFYRNNKELIEMKKIYSLEEQSEIDRLNNLMR